MNIAVFKRVDKILLFSTLLLVVLGLIAIFSVSYSGGVINFLNFQKQLFFAGVGLVLFYAAASTDYRLIKNYIGMGYGLIVVVLVGVLVLGQLSRGTASWFNVGMFGIQPSEFAKVVLIVVLARYLAGVGASYDIYRKIAVSGLYAALPIALVLLQPDMGSALVMMFIWFGMLLMFGLGKKQVLLMLVLGIVAFVGAWQLMFKDYQKQRILNFVNPQADPLGSGYNVLQSMIAIGSGGPWGKGLGHGSQSQLEFLPEKHTDFIFAVIGEEMGLVGATLVLMLFLFIFWRLYKIALEAEDNFGRLIVLGVLFMIFFHMVVNVGMNMGVMPVTGIPLPFVSYGGSSLLAFMFAIGLTESVYVHGCRYGARGEEDIF